MPSAAASSVTPGSALVRKALWNTSWQSLVEKANGATSYGNEQNTPRPLTNAGCCRARCCCCCRRRCSRVDPKREVDEE